MKKYTLLALCLFFSFILCADDVKSFNKEELPTSFHEIGIGMSLERVAQNKIGRQADKTL